MITLTALANEIQGRKHEAQLNTSKAARDSEWDSEAYWRAYSEGLQAAEKIVRKYAETYE